MTLNRVSPPKCRKAKDVRCADKRKANAVFGNVGFGNIASVTSGIWNGTSITSISIRSNTVMSGG